MKKSLMVPIITLMSLVVFCFSYKAVNAQSNDLNYQVRKFCDNKTDLTKVHGYLCNLLDTVAYLNTQIDILNIQIAELKNQLTFYQTMTTSEVLFEDNFDGITLSPDIWDIHDNGGMITVSNGELTLSSDGTTYFPFIFPKTNPMPPWGNRDSTIDNYSIEIRMRYNILGSNAGLGFQDDPNPDLNNFVGVNHLGGVWASAILSNGQRVIPVIDSDYHTYKFVATPWGFWHVYLDGQYISPSPGNPHAGSFFIGNYDSRNTNGSISVEYIKVTTLPDELYWKY